MKKSAITVIFMSMVFAGSAYAATSQPKGIISSMRGAEGAVIKGDDHRSLAVGGEITDGYTVNNRRGITSFMLPGGTVVLAESGSRFKVDFSTDRLDGVIQLLDGTIVVKVSGGDIAVRTAKALVIPSEGVTVISYAAGSLANYETVVVSTQGGAAVNLPSGEKIIVPKDGKYVSSEKNADVIAALPVGTNEVFAAVAEGRDTPSVSNSLVVQAAPRPSARPPADRIAIPGIPGGSVSTTQSSAISPNGEGQIN